MQSCRTGVKHGTGTPVFQDDTGAFPYQPSTTAGTQDSSHSLFHHSVESLALSLSISPCLTLTIIYSLSGIVNQCVCVCVCVCVCEVWRVQGMRRVEHARAQGLGSLRTSSLPPQLPLSPPKQIIKIGRKARNCAASVFLFIYSY